MHEQDNFPNYLFFLRQIRGQSKEDGSYLFISLDIASLCV